jgi:betaine-aldehyde dehydrogenase
MPGQTALVANLVSQIIAEVTSLPRGVVNIFTESGNTGAPYLVASPDVQVISYTGSTTVGRIVAANGAPTLKRMNLELGGKTPMIVFDDADLDSTIPLLAAGITTFAGEFCMTGSRILVQRGVADEVRTRLAGLLENVRVGDGMDPETDMGPLIDKADAIARANATEFGLAAGLFTSSINTSRRVSREIHAGTVWTNTWAAINDGFAEGGYKQSGIGRLRGPLAITEFTEAKTVVHAIPPLQG